MRNIVTNAVIVFDGIVAIRSYFHATSYLTREWRLKEMTIPEYGIVFPNGLFYPDGVNINRKYFEQDGLSGESGKLFYSLDSDGYFNVHLLKKSNENQLLFKVMHPIYMDRQYLSNGPGDDVASLENILYRAKSIVDFIYTQERVMGIPSEHYKLYSKQELVKYIKGDLSEDELTVTPVDPQFKFIWLK